MKRTLSSIILLFLLAQLSAQQDARKWDTFLDKKDKQGLKNLQENIPIIKQMLIQFNITTPASKKDSIVNRNMASKLRNIYQNLCIQELKLTQKIKLEEELVKEAAVLKALQKDKKYKTGSRKLERRKKLKRYRSLSNELNYQESKIRQELFQMMIGADSKQAALTQLIPFFNIALNSIGAKKVKPKLDSLNTVIEKKQGLVQELEKQRGLLQHSINTEQKENKIIKDSILTQRQRLSKALDIAANTFEEYKQEEAYQNKLLASIKEQLEQENYRIKEAQNQMQLLKTDYTQMIASLKLQRSKLEVQIKEQQINYEKLYTDNVNLTVEKEKNKIDLQHLKEAKDKGDNRIIVLSISLLLSMGVAWRYSDQKRRELEKTGLLLKQKGEQLQQKREQLEMANLKLMNRTDALELSHKELQHRVKNNLQKVSSLIFRRLFSIEDQQAKSVLSMLQDELGAIALIHQKLYADDHQKLTLVNIADYAEELVQSIVKQEAVVHIQVESIYIEMDNAVEIGLMLNELITNACKHGFSTIDFLEINVDITIKDKFIILKVQDNGNGFPERFSIHNNTTFGLLAISDIVRRHQENGSSLKIYNQKGANIEIRLPFDRQLGRLTA